MSKNEIERTRLRDWQSAGLHIDNAPSANEQQTCTCPECSATRKPEHRKQKCVSVNVELGLWTCSHCGAKGYVPSLKEIEERTNREKRIERQRNAPPEQKKYVRPKWVPEFMVGNLLNPHPQQQALIDYLTGERKLSLEVLSRARVSIPWVDRRCAISFNYFDRGQLINQKTRWPDKQFILCKGAELIPYNIDAILRKDVCYITEGEIDTLSLLEAGFPEAVSVPNGGSTKNLTWLDRFMETHFMDKHLIYLTLDLDETGIGLMKELIRRLGSGKCRIVLWDEGCKDANDELCRHGVEGIRRCIAQAVPVPLYGIQTAHTPEVERGLDDMFENGIGHGAPIGIKVFDQQISFETGRFMVVTGRPGDGKSEFVDELTLRLCLLHEWRVAYFSPENVPLKYHLSKLISKLTGFEFRKGGRMTPELYAACKDWLDLNFCHIMPGKDEGMHDPVLNLSSGINIGEELRPDIARPESFTLEEVLAVAREAVQRRGVRICVFDPLNSFRRDAEQARMKDLQWYLHVCNTLLGFAHENDVLVILIAHPRKVDRSMLDNRKRRVEMNDISGTSDFGNKSDFCLCIDLDDELKVVTIYVDKVKFKHLGTRGKVTLHYDMLSGRYVPCSVQKLSEKEFAMLEYQPRKSGEELITTSSGHYLKTTDWRNFNRRWIDLLGSSLLIA